jgi:hypothetical protein
VLKWRGEEQLFRAWYAWVMERQTDVWATDRWMDEVAHVQDMLVARDVPDVRHRADALERLRRAHLFYPGVQALQQDVQVRCNYVTAGIDEGDFVDAPLHDAIGARVLLSQALEHTGAQRVLVVAGSSS